MLLGTQQVHRKTWSPGPHPLLSDTSGTLANSTDGASVVGTPISVTVCCAFSIFSVLWAADSFGTFGGTFFTAFLTAAFGGTFFTTFLTAAIVALFIGAFLATFLFGASFGATWSQRLTCRVFAGATTFTTRFARLLLGDLLCVLDRWLVCLPFLGPRGKHSVKFE
jgi:hypothetical protein